MPLIKMAKGQYHESRRENIWVYKEEGQYGVKSSNALTKNGQGVAQLW